MIIPSVLLIDWYRRGIFPMAESKKREIYLYDPDPRAIILPEEFHLPRSLAGTIRAAPLDIRMNTAFERVIRACAQREETWISDEIRESYVNLHREGYAHSVEAWDGMELAGGLYGVALNGAFFGESMFHARRDASKMAMVALMERMKERNMILLDVQFLTPHLARFGAREIPREEYRMLLEKALMVETCFHP